MLEKDNAYFCEECGEKVVDEIFSSLVLILFSLEGCDETDEHQDSASTSGYSFETIWIQLGRSEGSQKQRLLPGTIDAFTT